MELLRTAMTYIIALVVILGGGWLLITPSQVPSEQLLPFLTGIIGAVIAFVFSERQQSATATSTFNAATKTNGEHAAIAAIHRRLDTLGAPPAADNSASVTATETITE